MGGESENAMDIYVDADGFFESRRSVSSLHDPAANLDGKGDRSLLQITYTDLCLNALTCLHAPLCLGLSFCKVMHAARMQAFPCNMVASPITTQRDKPSAFCIRAL